MVVNESSTRKFRSSMLIKLAATVLASVMLAAASPGPLAVSVEKRQSVPRLVGTFQQSFTGKADADG
jgi:hypothetical protein